LAKRDPHLVSFGSRLAALRKERKLTQEKLAERARLGSQYISNIERGAVNPSFLVLRGIAAGLGLSLARMFAEPDEIDLEVVAALAGRSKAERAKALAIVRTLFAPPEIDSKR
jgi:transcriptional regulator with XRE-family HTH domain